MHCCGKNLTIVTLTEKDQAHKLILCATSTPVYLVSTSASCSRGEHPEPVVWRQTTCTDLVDKNPETSIDTTADATENGSDVFRGTYGFP